MGAGIQCKLHYESKRLKEEAFNCNAEHAKFTLNF